MQISVWRSFEQIAPAWRELEAEGVGYGFQSFAWSSTWQETVGRAIGIEPYLVLVADTEGCPAMLFPLGIQRRLGLRRLCFLDGELMDYNAPLARRDFIQTMTAARFVDLWGAILKTLPEVDVIQLRKLPETIYGLRNPLLYLPCLPHRESSHSRLLDGNFADFLKQQPTKLRSDSRRQRRRLEQKGSLQFKVAATQAEVAAFVSTMIRQKSRRHWETGARDLLTSSAYRDFYLRMAERHAGSGLIHVSALLVDETIVASHFGMVFRDRYYYLMPTFESGQWRPFSPGRILLEHLVEWAYAQNLTVFDMTVGDEEYKSQWTNQIMPLHDYHRAATLQDQVAHNIFQFKEEAKDYIRANPRLLHFAKKGRETLRRWTAPACYTDRSVAKLGLLTQAGGLSPLWSSALPHKANAARHHRIARLKRRVTNWAE